MLVMRKVMLIGDRGDAGDEGGDAAGDRGDAGDKGGDAAGGR